MKGPASRQKDGVGRRSRRIVDLRGRSSVGCTAWQSVVNEKESSRDKIWFNATATFVNTGSKNLVDIKRCESQPNSTARTPGQGLLTERRTIRFWIRWPVVFCSFPDCFRIWTSVPPRSKETSSIANFIKWMPRPCSAPRFSTARGLGTLWGSNPSP